MDIVAIVNIIQAGVQLYDQIRERWLAAHPDAPPDQAPPTAEEVVAKARDLQARFRGQEERATAMLEWLATLPQE
jgi:hypothetical protein